jgi:spermidine dehydrogenase
VADLAGTVAPLARRAIEDAEVSEQLTSDDWFDLGVDLEAVSPEDAPAAYLRALELDPYHSDAHVNLGRLLQEAGEYQTAEQHYTNAMNAEPDNVLAAFNLGTLLEDMGVDVSLASKVFDHDLYPSLGLQCGVFFDKKTFGKDKLVAGDPSIPLIEHQGYVTVPAELEKSVGDPDAVNAFLEKAPLSAGARQEIFALFCGTEDYLEGKSHDEKLSILQSVSYRDFLKKYVDASPEVIDFFWMWHGGYMGSGTDLAPAIAAFRYGLPGAAGLGVDDALRRRGDGSQRSDKDDFHFPDGNASIARLLVRHMIPAVAPGDSMHDIVSAKFDYSELDRPQSPVRIRLNATAVQVRHLGDPDTAKQVEVTYVQDGAASRVRARHCVMACYHSIIPQLCPEISGPQQEALKKTIRIDRKSVV